MLAGWGIGFAALRPAIPGLGPWASIGHVLRSAGARAPARSEQDGRAARLTSTAVWALAGYGALSVVLWGLPLASELRSALIAENSIDPSVYTWFYGWWPHAIVLDSTRL